MNRERAKELLPIIQAFAEGKTIQYRENEEDVWELGLNLNFYNHWQYRIKPEPREFWITLASNKVFTFVGFDEKYASQHSGELIKVREVIE